MIEVLLCILHSAFQNWIGRDYDNWLNNICFPSWEAFWYLVVLGMLNCGTAVIRASIYL